MSTSAVMPSSLSTSSFKRPYSPSPLRALQGTSHKPTTSVASFATLRASPAWRGECFARARIALRACEALLKPSAGSGGKARGDAISGGGRQQGHCASQAGQSHLGQRWCVQGTNGRNTHAYLREPRAW